MLNFDFADDGKKPLQQNNLKFDPELFLKIFDLIRQKRSKKKRTVIAPPIA